MAVHLTPNSQVTNVRLDWKKCEENHSSLFVSDTKFYIPLKAHLELQFQWAILDQARTVV
jgi:hypothetical protein